MAPSMCNKVAEPLVSVITPFYNAEPYLADCIESVLSQTYRNYEYLLVNNCSTDDSLGIAKKYEKIDRRLKTIENREFLDQIKNHNHALSNISSSSEYCKVVAADDIIFTSCLEQMVNLAEADKRIGVVGAYTLLDWGNRSSVYLTGLPFHKRIYDGRDICRRFLLEGLYVFGPPTATLIRSDIVRNRVPFYFEDSVTEDVDIFFEILESWGFGFVPEILTYVRRSNVSTISTIRDGMMELTMMVEIEKYGRNFLNEDEYKYRRRKIRYDYHHMLGLGVLLGRSREFWRFHENGLRFVGQRLGRGRLALCALSSAMDLLLNPKSTVERAVKHWLRK